MAATILTRRCSYSFRFQLRTFATKPNHSSSLKNSKLHEENNVFGAEGDDVFATSGISRPISHILKELNKKVPDSLIKLRTEQPNGPSIKYIPWHIVNRIMNLHAPEWSGEVRGITYSADAKSVSVVYRVTLYGTDAEIFRESTGTTLVSDTGYGDAVQKAEAMAFRRACARFGLGLHLYHEDLE
ncbi:hypothetical protein ACJIZ3_003133 [Penstemon smallii]|uniref:DNA repair RAD52-like protein 1, mitochondrial n=1 Tax=Penstemon smallii TaxID=265156 RepID=A0ABD3U9T7_9LAMI